MNSTFVTRLRGGISAVSLAVLFSASGVLGTMAGLSPAYAQTALTADQASSIQTSLTASIQAAGNNPTAVEAAISQALQTAISTYGAGATASITNVVLTTSEADGVAPGQIGTGLAQAAVAVSASSPVAAATIATTVGTEGRGGEVASFSATASSSGSVSLASAASGASGTAAITGAITNAGGITGAGTGGGAVGGGAAGGGGGCLNPSCTAL